MTLAPREGAKFFSNNWNNIFWLTRDWPHMMFLKHSNNLNNMASA